MTRAGQSTDEPVRMSARTRIRRFLVTGVVLLSIGYGTILLMSRTEGFRSILSAQLQKRIGASLFIGGSYLNPGLDLRLSDVQWTASNVAPAGVSGVVERISIDGAPGLALGGVSGSVTLVGPALDFVRAGDTWAPTGVTAWATVVADALGLFGLRPDEALQLDPGDLALHLHGGSFRWREADGALRARVDELSVEIQPIILPARRMTYFRAAGLVQMPGGEGVERRVLEMISTQDRVVVLERTPQS